MENEKGEVGVLSPGGFRRADEIESAFYTYANYSFVMVSLNI